MASSKTAVAKKSPAGKGTAVVSWKDRLAGYAKQAVAVADEAAGGGQFISFKAGQITYNGAACAGNKLDVIVVHSVLENACYGGEYDPDNPQPPVCFAFGETQAEMVPHEKSSEPQADSCAVCFNNVMGSADKGKGKACKNVVRLALLPAKPLTVEALEKTECAYAKLPVTSGKGYAAYVKRLSTLHGMPPFAFVTQLGTVPDAKTQFKVTFDAQAEISDDEVLEAIIAKHEEQIEAIKFPYAAPTVVEAPAKKPAGRAVAKAKKY